MFGVFINTLRMGDSGPLDTDKIILDKIISKIHSNFNWDFDSKWTKAYCSVENMQFIRQAIKTTGYKTNLTGNVKLLKKILSSKGFPPECISTVLFILDHSVCVTKEMGNFEHEYGWDELSDPSELKASPSAKIQLIMIDKYKSKYLTLTQFLKLASQTQKYNLDQLHDDDIKRFFLILIQFCYNCIWIAGYQIGSQTYKILDKSKKPSPFTPHLINSHQLPLSYYLAYAPYDYLFDDSHPSDFEIYNHFVSSFKPDMDISKFRVISEGKTLLHCSDGFNIDGNGSDGSTHAMDFHTDWLLPSTFTIVELAEGLFRLRSHKWDRDCEIYCRCKYEQNYISTEKYQYKLDIEFNHC